MNRHEPEYLIIDEHGTASLSHTLPGDGDLLAVDLGEARRRFLGLTRGRDQFTATDLATIAGAHYAVIARWVQAGLLVSVGLNRSTGEKIYDLDAAFAVGVLGALRRRRQSLPVLRSAADLLMRDTRAALAAAN